MLKRTVGPIAMIGAICVGSVACAPPPTNPPTFTDVSLGQGGVRGNGHVTKGVMNATGDYTAFRTESTNVMAGDVRPGPFLRH